MTYEPAHETAPARPDVSGDTHEDTGLDVLGPRSHRGHRRARKRRGRGITGCLTTLLVLGLIVAGLYVGLTKGVGFVRDQFADPEDYPGPGSGSVTVEVQPGDTATDIGRTLAEADVVASVEAFTDAANGRADEAATIQAGYYEMRKQMSSDDALDVLVDPNNLIQATVTIPEGLRVTDIVDVLAEKTDFSKKQWQNALKKTDQLGLPKYAEGDPEGYLFPATYTVKPGDKPIDVLRAMVDRWRQAADEADLEGSAKKLGYTPAELMTIASLVESEARGDDMPKVARVIYNRLETDGPPTYGKLEIDATVNYALGRNLGVALSQEDLAVDSPYNTRKYAGLPPGPIEAPGDDAIAAAANPAEGPWFFYVTVDLKTGETKFTDDYDEFLQYKAELQEYCETSDAC
ncbi:endolytic transglycosylase MltG [Nocardioides guangzhouensis]|uniref:Endolytic murein transglycosylase n=1 Tax=Nocardioides guangzhouensis TaxID=2497878 RepID=A0A4Q4ZFP2_9ACTN|nr:endolytic transglycosylase MltG [Nocardioides guangzhouensis]RYP86094.1 endolytic transglycosylase MltG [Nocardioides guangzhouensis]